jgi:hypothetical protein
VGQYGGDILLRVEYCYGALFGGTISKVHLEVMEQPNPNRVAKTEMEWIFIDHIPRIQTGPKVTTPDSSFHEQFIHDRTCFKKRRLRYTTIWYNLEQNKLRELEFRRAMYIHTYVRTSKTNSRNVRSGGRKSGAYTSSKLFEFTSSRAGKRIDVYTYIQYVYTYIHTYIHGVSKSWSKQMDNFMGSQSP